MNDLENFFYKNTGEAISKWKHYFEIYDRYFSRFRGKEVTIVEFGVLHGGSLMMWKDYFGKGAKIYGIDINPACKSLEDEQIKIIIGSQEDRNFLRKLVYEIPRIDILIDDGGHTMEQQKLTFEELYQHIDEDGIFLCEDIHTSYWRKYGGGYKKRGSFVEYSKNFIDYIHAWHAENKRKLPITDFTRSTYALHYYDSMLVIEKRRIIPPETLITGSIEISKKHRPRKTIMQHIKKLLSMI